jgi:ATP-dependent helicase/nuclease subunit B
MGVRLVAGRAGAGKTHWCQSQIADALAERLIDGPPLILLTPEQAALQMERALLARSPSGTLGRCEVLSFRRLAHRILSLTAQPVPEIISPNGSQMVLRHLIAKHRRSLKEFAKVAHRTGFIQSVQQTIVELLQDCVSIDDLEECEELARSDGDPSEARLHDLSLIYRAYLDFLGSQRVDPEGVLDLARARMASGDFIVGARIWIDGFAGLTGQQLRMIVALAQRAAHIDVALLLDTKRGQAADPDAAPDELSIFVRMEQTWATLSKSLYDAGVEIEPPKLLGQDVLPRFEHCPVLANVELRLFSVVPDAKSQPDRSENPDSIRIIEFADRRQEVAAVVRQIRDLVVDPPSFSKDKKPLRYRDIAVIVRDLEPYHDLLSADLTAAGIPFFIDRRQPTHHHPLVRFVRASLALAGGGDIPQNVVSLLKSSLTGLDNLPANELENYLLAYRLSAPGAWREPWTHSPDPDSIDTKDGVERPLSPSLEAVLARINIARQTLVDAFADWWPDGEAGSRSRHCKKWVAGLYELMERLQIRKSLAAWASAADSCDDLAEPTLHRQVWADLVKLLDELSEVLGETSMTARQFREVVDAGLAEFTLGLVPPTLDQVLVSSIERSRHPPIRAAFVLGLVDGQFPAAHADDSLLSDHERSVMQKADVPLTRSRLHRILDERALAYIAFTRTGEFLWASHPASDERGRSLEPSPFWSGLIAASGVSSESAESSVETTIDVCSAPQLSAELALHLRKWCEESLSDTAANPWLALFEWSKSQPLLREPLSAALRSFSPIAATGQLSAGFIQRLWHPPHTTSVSRLESFARCPFQHFATYGLQLSPRPTQEVRVAQIGRLYHEILEQFVNELMETGQTLKELSPAQVAESLSRSCELIVPRFAEAAHLDDPDQRKLSWRCGKELPAAIDAHKTGLAQTGLSPIAVEKKFGFNDADALPAIALKLSDGRQVLIRGKIDRIDLLPLGDKSLAMVFDYKRSMGKRLRLEEVYHGLALQLLAYLLVIRDHGDKLSNTRIIPTGSFYLPLVAGLPRVDHPSEADKAGFNPHAEMRPAGVFDFDWIDSLDPECTDGTRSRTIRAGKLKDGKLANANRSDAVASGQLPLLLDHVRSKLTSLAEAWLSGDVAVRPAHLGKDLPCTYCDYRAVCRFEHATRETNALVRMTNTEVLTAIAEAAAHE